MAEDLVVGSGGLQFTFNLESGDRVINRVPAYLHTDTAPRRGVSSLGCWSFDGVIVLSARIPARTSAVEAFEGVGVT